MRKFLPTYAAALVALCLVPATTAISSVTRVGRYLYDANGRFYIKGIAYQEQGSVIADPNNPFGEPSTFIDPLANTAACQRDIPYLKNLTVNTIRVYSANASLNHDGCMRAFSDAGIYTIIDLSLPNGGSIDRLNPSWTTELLDVYIAGVNAFYKYDNVLAFNIGNEVVADTSTTASAAYVKAAARDIKAYLASVGSSALVGYAAIDGPSDFRTALAEYLSCDPSGTGSGSTAIDLYGLNNYEWCGSSTFAASYTGVETDYTNYNVVAYFGEYGCITSGTPRPWTEVQALFGPQMSPVWSGGIAFSYFPAASSTGQFGMVTIAGSTVTTSQDYANLVEQYSSVTPPTTPLQANSAASVYPSCPAESSNLQASTTLPPTPNDAACNCLQQTLSCRFTPQTKNVTAVVGPLIDSTCGLLASSGVNCNDISSNGTGGTYGRVSSCSPSVKLSFVMSEYYEAHGRSQGSCSFAGNATVNPSAPSSVSAANAAASSCLSNPSATFVPTAPTGTATGSGSSPSTTSNKKSNAVKLGDMGGLSGIGVMLLAAVLSGIWALV